MKEQMAPGAKPEKNEEVPLAIIGIGCLFPKAKDHAEFWANIKNGVDSITEIPKTHWSPDDYFDNDPKKSDQTYAQRGGFISAVDFDPLAYGIPPSVLEATDTSQLLGMVAAGEALRDAGYGKSRQFDRDRVSVILGVTGTLELVIPLGARLGHPIWRRSLAEAGVDDAIAEDVVQRIADSYVPWQENSFPGLLGNVVAGRISKFLDVGGTNCVVDAACASSLSAIHLAGMELATGRSDMVVTGGIDTFNDIFMYMCFSKTPALSPTGNAKPFDENGDGTILGEGLGLIVLKRLADAERDGDRVYAVIRSMGSSSDGKGEAIYAPSANGQKKAIRRAYAAAGVTPDTIEMVEAHGTGTRVGDAVEASALNEVYGEADRDGSWCALGSVKSQIGHTKAAAGIAGIIKTALALHHKVLPPTIKVGKPLAELASSPLYVNTTMRPWVASETHPRRAAVSAFGFGGSNFHCLLEEVGPEKRQADWDGEVQLFTYSGDDADSIRKSISTLSQLQSWDAVRVVASESRRTFRTEQKSRLAFVLERDKSDIAKLVSTATTMLDRSAESSWSTPDGVFYGTGEPEGKLAMIFPGQGSQYVGMLRDLSCLFPQMLDALRDANHTFALSDTRRLTDLIYPPPAFDPVTAQNQEDDLRAIEVAQPAIGAVSVGAFGVLSRLGVKPAAVAGHSYGELMALCAAGAYDSEALYSLSRLRAQLMASGDADKGTMLAVRAPLHIVEQLVADERLDLVVANRNAPSQAVLSGAAVEIERALEACSRRKIQSKKIAVAAAFHSPLVAHALEPFLAALREIDFSVAAIPVFANTSAREYPVNVDEARELLATQLASPVDFVGEILAMHDHGVRTFVEVGPGARLTALVHSILEKRDHTAVALDASSGQRSGVADLARLLAQLTAEGRSIDLSQWDDSWRPPAEPDRKPKMTVPISGANHFPARPKRPPVTPKPSALPAATGTTHSPLPLANRTAYSPLPAGEGSGVRVPVSGSRTGLGTANAGASNSHLGDILRATRESMLALQRMQEQTANVHAQFLAGQEAAARTFQTLLEQQARMLGIGGPGQNTTEPLWSSRPGLNPGETRKEVATRSTEDRPRLSQPAPASAPTPVIPLPAPRKTARFEIVLLDVVSTKTGYPIEMLELDMSLDADLGIDSIKRVEILSALEEQLPDSPRIEAEHIGRLQTLRAIVDHLSDKWPMTSTTAGAEEESAAQVGAIAPTPVGVTTEIETVLLDVVSSKTGYPIEMLELDMSLDADLGIDSIKRVEILSALEERLPNSPRIEAEHIGRLQTLRAIVDHLSAGVAPVAAKSVNTTDAVSEIESVLLEIVSAKTGYPTAMLEFEMSLDADLGIDSIKRVEILSALEERLPNAPRIEAEHIGRLQTLRAIVEHLSEKWPKISTSADRREVATADGMSEESAEDAVSEVESVLLEVVSAKTGYPTAMLELEMSLDADLGIDSIKRVEILSALEERLPKAPRIEAEHIGKLQTLRAIVDHLSIKAPVVVKTQPAIKIAVSEITSEPATVMNPDQRLQRSEVALVAANDERPAVELDKNLELWITDDLGHLSIAIARVLEARGYHSRVVDFSRLPETSPAGFVIVTPEQGADDTFLRDALLAAKTVSSRLCETGRSGAAVFLTVSRQNGSFGFGVANDQADMLSGALAGLAKTAGREWLDVHCKAIDIARDLDCAAVAESIVDEILLSGPAEIGLSSDGTRGLELVALAPSDSNELPVGLGDVVIISGGARGVTAAAAIALARRAQPTLVLLGRSPEPAAEPEWLASSTSEADIKRGVVANSNTTLTPRELQARYDTVVAGREIARTIDEIVRAGARAIYRSIDIRDGSAVAGLVETIRRDIGPIRGIIHGAGVLADRLIAEKTAEQFDRVWSTKVIGGRNLLEATSSDALRFIAFFSSSTARFGRLGQVDYAMANEALNKMAQREAGRRHQCRVVSFNWGPWNGGMVTPALASVFANEGIGLIDLEAGSSLLLDELCRPADGAVEVVVLATVENEVKAKGAIDDVHKPVATFDPAFQLRLNIKDFPFLESHVINGRAVVPMAVILEWVAQGAIARNPGMRIQGVDDLRLFKGLTLGESEQIDIQVRATKASRSGSHYAATVELAGIDPAGSERIHVRATVLMGNKAAESREVSALPRLDRFSRTIAQTYDEILFHGSEFQSIESIEGVSDQGIRAFARSAPSPSSWMTQPIRNVWLTDPLAIDASFQLLIVWSAVQHDSRSLPSSIARYRQFKNNWPAEGVEIVVSIRKSIDRQTVSDIEFIDRKSGELVASIEGFESTVDAALQAAFRLNRLPGPAVV